jgi:predicted DNA-binding transcriptional regulator AlpA
MARPISTEQFAAEVRERLIDTHEVAKLLGLRQKQTIYARVAVGALPPPIIKLERGYAFWDRLAITNATPTRR